MVQLELVSATALGMGLRGVGSVCPGCLLCYLREGRREETEEKT